MSNNRKRIQPQQHNRHYESTSNSRANSRTSSNLDSRTNSRQIPRGTHVSNSSTNSRTNPRTVSRSDSRVHPNIDPRIAANSDPRMNPNSKRRINSKTSSSDSSGNSRANARDQYNEYGQPRRNSKSPYKKKRKKRRRKKFLLFIEIIIILLAILFGIYYFVFSKLQQDNVNMKDVTINNFSDENIKDYRNIALFGVDSQTNELGEGNRSDAMIVASINKKTKQIKLLSLYRDTYLNVERESGAELTKLTHAYAYGGPKLAVSTINQNLDLNITDYVTVNFKALADTVDLLGGVELNIQEAELSNLNDYIGNMNKINGGNSPKLTHGGTQTLDGNQAVAYCRIRYVGNGDFRRTERQREVIAQIVKKAKTTNPITLTKIVQQVFPQTMTSLDSLDVLALSKDIFSYEIVETQGFPFNTTGTKLSGIYYGIPTTLESNVSQAHQFLFGTENYVPSDTVKAINNRIINYTGIQ